MGGGGAGVCRLQKWGCIEVVATVLTYPERVTEYSLAKLKQRVAAGVFFLGGG